jgi:hypothetical protein
VKRVKGDGLTPSSSADLFARVKSTVTNSSIEDELPTKRGKLRDPLPLPAFALKRTISPISTYESSSPSSSSDSSSYSADQSSSSTPPSFSSTKPCLISPAVKAADTFSSRKPAFPPIPSSKRGGGFSPLPLCCGIQPSEVTNDQFLKGLKPITSMVKDTFYEPRLEATKMLCDIAQKDKKFLNSSECQSLCFQALDKLLLDDFDDVKQFAIIAFSLFVENENYQKLFLELKSLPDLVSLIGNSSREIPSYVQAQIRRKSSCGISLMAKSHAKEITEQLKESGYETKQQWFDHCATILDKKTREYAMNIGNSCYHEEEQVNNEEAV